MRISRFYAPIILSAGVAFVLALLLAYPAAPLRAPGLLDEPPPPFGWHLRAKPHPDGAAYEIKKENLVFAMKINAMLDPDGLTVALFKPNLAIDAVGRVFTLSEPDWSALANLAAQAAALPKANPNGLWEIRDYVSCLPMDHIYIATPSGLQVVSVLGYHPRKTLLFPNVGGFTRLPEPLQMLIGYGREGWEDSEGIERYGDGYDNEVTYKVKAILEPSYR